MASEPLGDRVRRQLLRLGTRQPFEKGDQLMLAGGRSDVVLLIESGTVQVTLSAFDGVVSTVAFYGPGELIGELGVLGEEPRSATVVAQEAGHAVHVAGDRFRALVERDRDVLLFINEILRRRLRAADRRQLALVSWDVRSRVAAQLLDWAGQLGERQGRSVVVRGVTQHVLAQTVGASQKSVEAELRALRAAGLIETGRQRLTVLRPNSLRALLREPGRRS